MSVTTTGTIARSEADTQWSVFQLTNVVGTTFSNVGGFFSLAIAWKFTGHGIPQGATILSASIDVTAAFNNAGAAGLEIGASANNAIAAWQPDTFGDAWRQSIWGRFKALVRDTGGGTIINTVTGTPATSWALLFESDMRKRLAQSFIPPAAATLGDIRLRLARAGAPGSSLVVDIMLGDPANNPDEVAIATSDPVLTSAVPTSFADVTFSFRGADQIALAAGTTYFAVLRPVTPWTVNGSDFISWTVQNTFFSLGGSRFFGTGSDFDDQNYPLHVDVWGAFQSSVGTAVPWSPPTFFGGTTYTTPDLTALVQAIVDQPTYGPGAPIAMRLSRAAGGAGGARRIATFDNATLPAAVLNVEYEAPTIAKRVVGVNEARAAAVDEARQATVSETRGVAIEEERTATVNESRISEADC